MSSEPQYPLERIDDLHRRIHAKPRPPRYQPITVAEALARLRRSLEASIMLGIYSFIYGDHNAAMGIVDAEREVDELAYQLLAHVSIAVGYHVEDAAKAAPIYTYVLAVDKVMDALKDLATMIVRGHRLSRDIVERLLATTDMPVARLDGHRFSSVGEVLERYRVDVIAYRGPGGWRLAPDNSEKLTGSETLYVWGAKDMVNKLLEDHGARPLPDREDDPLLGDITSSIEMLPVMNELAHYQLRAQDQVLADEILELEMFMDELRERNTVKVLESELSTDNKALLLTLITRVEDISDALTYIIVMPAEEEYREILSALVEAGEERVALYRATRAVRLGEVAEELEEAGVTLLAARMGREWVAVTPYNVERIVLRPGDAVLVEYEKPLEERVRRILEEKGFKP